jgi:hypothetical protein
MADNEAPWAPGPDDSDGKMDDKDLQGPDLPETVGIPVGQNV